MAGAMARATTRVALQPCGLPLRESFGTGDRPPDGLLLRCARCLFPGTEVPVLMAYRPIDFDGTGWWQHGRRDGTGNHEGRAAILRVALTGEFWDGRSSFGRVVVALHALLVCGHRSTRPV